MTPFRSFFPLSIHIIISLFYSTSTVLWNTLMLDHVPVYEIDPPPPNRMGKTLGYRCADKIKKRVELIAKLCAIS